MVQAVNTFIEKLSGTECVDHAQGLVAKTLADFGIENYAYFAFNRFSDLDVNLPDLPREKPVLLHSYAQEWVDRYVENDYANIDPVVETGLASVVSFGWGGNKYRKVLGDKSRAFMDEASEFGLAKGYTVPVHGVRGEVGALSVALSNTSQESEKHFQAFSHEIQLIALHFHTQMGERILSQEKHKQIRLSKRERECLLWAAEGKTAWETGEILKISENTVREYIKNACRKLNVHSKNHAVVKAMVLGLIKPNV